MGVITVSLDDDVERILRMLAARRGKKKGALSETIRALVENVGSQHINKLIEELEKGFPINARKISRDDIYADRLRH